jgi:hypothetical protein
VKQTSIAFLLPLFLLACTSSPESDVPTDEQNIEEARFEAPKCDGPQDLCLKAPVDGFQITSVGTEIMPGEDVEYCEVVVLPGTPDDAYVVNAFESQMTESSHHLIVAAIEAGTATEENAIVGDRKECTGPDAFGGELVPVTGSQQPYNSEMFPDGVGRTYYGGQKIVFDYHYFNTTSAPITARAAVNFHTTDPSNVSMLARSFGFLNLGIEIPPGATKEFTKECTFDRDIYVHKLTRHTHKWGTDFKAWFVGGPLDGELALDSPDYETVNFPLEEPVLMPAGSGFKFSCAYENTEDYTLTFGLKATDEMCILFGSWYVEGDQDVDGQGCLSF